MARLRHAVALAVAGLTVGPAAQAQPTPRAVRIGVCAALDGSSSHLFAEFRRGLRDLGYVEGQNVSIHWGGTGGPVRIVAEVMRLNPDIILATASATASAAKRATSTTPIVMVSGDPIADGLVGSLSRPGGNVTGVSTLASDIVGKQVELLKQAVPRLSRVAILSNPDNRFHGAQVKEAESAIQALGAQPHVVAVRGRGELARAFSEMAKARADALLVLADGPVFLTHRAAIAELAAKARLPAMHPRREHVEAGGLMAYGTDRRALFYRLASYVDKIAKGAKPAELPVEQPTTFELVLNLKVARALALTLPASLLQRADHVVE
jgi:putative ABC transport system substrate-binding protein